VIPGFFLSLGFTVVYLSLIVLIPLSAVFLKTLGLSWDQFVATVTSERVMASYRLTFGASFLAAMTNGIFGLIVAWVLVRYPFPGACAGCAGGLPFALPTAVAGITLALPHRKAGWGSG
jgi:sulfate transport system permease protein